MRNTEGPIGGYFELEISSKKNIYHNDALALNSGRNAFEYILRSIKYKRIHMPYFTCDVMLQPIKKLDLDFTFYHIDDFFNPIINDFKEGDVVLYTNYFGFNFKRVLNVLNKYENVIVDNSQAFFDRPIEHIPTFYSPRKFFGVADGGFVYISKGVDSQAFQKDKSLERMSHLFTRIEEGPEAGYYLFKENDKKLNNQPIRQMSNITRKLLEGIDYDRIKEIRLINFNYLHENLKFWNKHRILIEDSCQVSPMVYPFWYEKGSDLRKKFHENKIFTSVYWTNVKEWVTPGALENELVDNVVYLPIDQRYSIDDMQRIINYV